MMKRALTLFAGLALLAPTIWAETYSIDGAHSSVGFRIKHLVGKVNGKFDKFTGTFTYDPTKPQATAAEATIDATSIDTGIQKRDDHLRSNAFFDVQKYPTVTFKSERVVSVTGTKTQLAGQLTMHGVTKPIVLDVDVAGVVKDPMGGGNRAGVSATSKVNRNDFAIGMSSGPMAGMIGSDVEIMIDVEGTTKK